MGVVTLSNIIVLKVGGSTIDELSDQFFANILTLQQSGTKPIIVHGGGPAIKDMLMKLNIETEFIDGLRKTTEPVMDVVEMVLTGTVNNALTRKLNFSGIQAVGLSGSDFQLLVAEPKNFERYGYVGEITGVNVSFLQTLIEEGIVPVISPIAIGEDGVRYNVNADTVAGAVAREIGASQLIFVTDVPGILKDEQLLEHVDEEEIHHLIESGVIYGGMLPKVQAALNSLNDELKEVMIVNGTDSLIGANNQLIGTKIVKTTVGER